MPMKCFLTDKLPFNLQDSHSWFSVIVCFYRFHCSLSILYLCYFIFICFLASFLVSELRSVLLWKYDNIWVFVFSQWHYIHTTVYIDKMKCEPNIRIHTLHKLLYGVKVKQRIHLNSYLMRSKHIFSNRFKIQIRLTYEYINVRIYYTKLSPSLFLLSFSLGYTQTQNKLRQLANATFAYSNK